jgi:hypothetical protein
MLRNPLRKLALALAAVVAVGAIAEFYQRWFQPVLFMAPVDLAGPTWSLAHRASELPGLDYELRPDHEAELNGVSIAVSSHGMRDAEPLPP